MGKKSSRRNVRISKSTSSGSTNITIHEKKNLNHLVKALKPSVYITDSSNFKCLVQELTGNGITIPHPISNPTPISSPSSISSIISQPIDDQQQVQLMQNNIIVVQDYYYDVQESSPKWSFQRSCSEIINVPLTTFDTWETSKELNMSTQIFSNDMIDQFHSSVFGSNEDMSLIQYGDEIEYSWISEMNNPFVYNHDNAPIMPAELCEYAYDLSGML